MERGRLDVAPMITTRRPFADTLGALAESTDRRHGKVMVTLDPG